MALKSTTTSNWRDYIEVCKPRVVALMLLTVVVGMYLASPGLVTLSRLCSSLLGIGLCAASAAAINHTVDKRIDALMTRTQARPVATGRISVTYGLVFASSLHTRCTAC